MESCRQVYDWFSLSVTLNDHFDDTMYFMRNCLENQTVTLWEPSVKPSSKFKATGLVHGPISSEQIIVFSRP